MMSRTTGSLLSLMFIMSTVPSQAATRNVEMQEGQFVPTSAITALGSTVRWTNTDPIVHSSTKFAPFPASWNRMLNPGQSWGLVMAAAGAFSYYCDPHSDGVNGMRGTVRVPIGVSATSITKGSVATLRFSTRKLGGPWVFDVDIKRGSGAWTRTRTGYAGATLAYKPPTTGTYLFRAALRNASTGRRSGVSPARKIVVR